jgi:hypothetical protein
MVAARKLRAQVLHARRGRAGIGLVPFGNGGYRPQFQHKTARPRNRTAVSTNAERLLGSG